MLFSDKQIAQYINENFESAWESERSVPTVTIDFGDGKEIKRTLHGNIATYVCMPDGATVDVLPGIYARDKYLTQLKTLKEQAVKLASYSEPERQKMLYWYHLDELTEINKRMRSAMRTASPPRLAAVGYSVAASPEPSPSSRRDFSKMVVESPVKRVIFNPVESAESNLGVDTAFNEDKRRMEVHKMLANAGLVQPSSINHWLYKEVLHADLDDPYLGLKAYLGKTYPWADEEGTD